MKLVNIVHVGLVKEIDYEKARVKVRMGELLTTWLLWITCQAGEEKSWPPLSLDEHNNENGWKGQYIKGYQKN
jgi:phage baseplate assembly protein gpV